MAEKTEKEPKADKAAKADKAPKGEKKSKKGGAADAAAKAGGKAAASGQADGPGPYPRLRKHYDDKVVPELKKRFSYSNHMQVPRFEKIVVNMGVGRATQQPSLLEGAVRDLTTITGQKPLVTRAKKSIAGFKLREGNSIGAKVTMRGDRMWEFLDRLISVAIPRVRDFRGLSPTSFDGRGNYTFGVTEQLIFPEIDYDKIDTTRGMDITIVTTARIDAHGKALLEAFGFPFRREV